MPTVRIPVDLTWSTMSGSPGVNVFHGRIGGIGDVDAQLEDMSAALNTFYDTIDAIFPGFVTVRFNGQAYGVGDDEGETYEAPTWTVNGLGDASCLPPANAICVGWKTNTGGRRGRGRTFLGPLSGSNLEGNGTPTEPRRALIQQAANSLIAESSGFANGALGIYSRVDNVFRDLAAATVPNEFAVLRSRRD